jgi:multidrug efflux system membrane fusion protein
MFLRLIIIPILSMILCACSNQPLSKESKAIPVSATSVTQKDVPVFLESLGIVQSSHTVEIRPQISGVLLEVLFQEGQTVKAGDILFVIDPLPAMIKLQEAEASIAMSRTSLLAAQKKLQRYKGLTNPNLIAPVDWDELEAQIAKFQAALQGDQAKESAAKLELERCSIKSPVSGKTGKLTVHKGNLVSASQTTPLISVSCLDPLYVDFSLTEKELAEITDEQMPIEISPLCDPGVTVQGKLVFLDNGIDTHSGMLHARGVMDNAHNKFWPGQSVRVRLRVAVIANAQMVPLKAVRTNEKGPYVYAVGPDRTAIVRSVTLGAQEGNKVIIETGLDLGDLVITEGHLRLTPGIKVDVVQEEPQGEK